MIELLSYFSCQDLIPQVILEMGSNSILFLSQKKSGSQSYIHFLMSTIELTLLVVDAWKY